MYRFWYDSFINTCITPCPYFRFARVGSIACQKCPSHRGQSTKFNIVQCVEDELEDHPHPLDIKVGVNKVSIIVPDEFDVNISEKEWEQMLQNEYEKLKKEIQS